MAVAAAAIFVILVCLCSTSKANLLSKNKEPQQTHDSGPSSMSPKEPEAEFSSADFICPDSTCTMTSHPGTFQRGGTDYRVYVYHMCNVGSAMGTGQQPIPEPNSSAELTALICTSTFEEWHTPHSTSSWSRVVAVMPTFTCGQEGCDLRKRRGLLEEATSSPCHMSLLPSRCQKASNCCQ